MDAARTIIDRHAQAINERDLDVYRATLNLPFVYQNYNGVTQFIETAAACGTSVATPWENILTTDPDWSHSVFDQIDEIARSVASVVYKVTFRRVDQAGQSSATYQAIWIATCQAGHWGIQFRHNLGQQEA